MIFRKKNFPQNLNICFSTQKLPHSERSSDCAFLLPIVKGMKRLGHNVHIITAQTSKLESQFIQAGAQLHFLDTREIRKNNLQSEVRRKFKELHTQNSFHIFHSMDRSGLSVSKRRKLYDITSIFDIKATQIAQLFSLTAMRKDSLNNMIKTDFVILYKYLRTYWGYDRALLNSAHAMFVSSPQERNVLERYYYYPDARIYQIPYGPKLSPSISNEIKEQLKQKYQLTSDNQCIATISDMTEIEDLKNILRAFYKVVIKKPDSRLIIMGDGPHFFDLEYEVLSLALGSKVILTGAVSDEEVAGYISICDIFINISSRSSGFEPSILTAMELEKTIVGSEVSPLASFVEDGVDGFLVRPADIQGIGQLLLDIFRGQLDTREIGKKASQKVSDYFDSEKLVINTYEAYKKILARQGYRIA